LLKGGDSGPAILPGKVEESLLIRAVRHTGDLKMPSGKRSLISNGGFARGPFGRGPPKPR
jgi:hypothetical protein